MKKWNTLLTPSILPAGLYAVLGANDSGPWHGMMYQSLKNIKEEIEPPESLKDNPYVEMRFLVIGEDRSYTWGSPPDLSPEEYGELHEAYVSLLDEVWRQERKVRL